MDPKEVVDTKPIERLIEKLSASSVFGEPTKEDDTVVIPVAQVAYGFGYGGAFSEGRTQLGKASSVGEETGDLEITVLVYPNLITETDDLIHVVIEIDRDPLFVLGSVVVMYNWTPEMVIDREP